MGRRKVVWLCMGHRWQVSLLLCMVISAASAIAAATHQEDSQAAASSGPQPIIVVPDPSSSSSSGDTKRQDSSVSQPADQLGAASEDTKAEALTSQYQSGDGSLVEHSYKSYPATWESVRTPTSTYHPYGYRPQPFAAATAHHYAALPYRSPPHLAGANPASMFGPFGARPQYRPMYSRVAVRPQRIVPVAVGSHYTPQSYLRPHVTPLEGQSTSFYPYSSQPHYTSTYTPLPQSDSSISLTPSSSSSSSSSQVHLGSSGYHSPTYTSNTASSYHSPSYSSGSYRPSSAASSGYRPHHYDPPVRYDMPVKIIRTVYNLPPRDERSEDEYSQIKVGPYTTVMELPSPLVAMAKSYTLLASGAYNMAFKFVTFLKDMFL